MINLHNHTTFSDGKLTPEELVQAAINYGFSHIGISDHFRTSKLGASAQYVIPEFWDEYVEHIRRLASTYAGQITVLAGIEIDFSPRTALEQLWPRGYSNSLLNDLDYALFEYVNDQRWEGLPLTALLSYRRWIKPPVGLAHTLFARSMKSIPAADLARQLAENDIFVELCPSPRNSVATEDGDWHPYYRFDDPYHDALFNALGQQGVRFSIGTDTHSSPDEFETVHDAIRFLQEKGLTEQLITQTRDTTTS